MQRELSSASPTRARRLTVAAATAVVLAAAAPAAAAASGPDGNRHSGGSPSWSSRAALPVGMAENGVVAVDGAIYAIGGTMQQSGAEPVWSSRLNLKYDPWRNTWKQMAPVPAPVSHAGVTAVGGLIFVVGGFTDAVHLGPQRTVFVYSPRLDRWTSAAPLPEALGSVATATVDGRIHVFGGRDSHEIVPIPVPPGVPPINAGFGTVTSHYVYTPWTNRWTTAAPLPTPARDHMGVGVLDGKVHLVGGRTADTDDNLTRHDVYDPRTNRWSSGAPLPTPRSAGASAVLEGRLVYAGGECAPGGIALETPAFTETTSYDPRTDTWSTLPPVPGPRHAFGAATIGRTAYFIGGADVCGGGTTTTTYALGGDRRP